MKYLAAFAMFLTINAAHALTLSGQAPAGAKKIWATVELRATTKLPIKCTHYNLMGPIFNGGESHGWHINRQNLGAEGVVDETGHYSLELDFKKLAKGICHYAADSLAINAGASWSHQVYLNPNRDATETVFNFDLTLPYSWENISEPANIRYDSVFEVNFR